MKKYLIFILKIFVHVKNYCTFAPELHTFLNLVIAIILSVLTTDINLLIIKDNTPSRLTSVAHLGGFLFL